MPCHPDLPVRNRFVVALLLLGAVVFFGTARPGDGRQRTPAPEPIWDPALLRRVVEGPSAAALAPMGGRFEPDGVPLLGTFGGQDYAPTTPARLLPALLEHAGGAGELEALGFRVLASQGRMRAVLGAPEAFEHLREAPGPLRVARLARPVTASLDRSLPRLGMTHVRSGTGPTWAGPTGRGVIVGVVDSGLDIHHEDFRHPDGSTRVLAFWDQTTNHTSSEVPIGALYRQSKLDELLLTATAEGVGFDLDGHGTHVAGIAGGDGSAAGSGLAFQFVGVAPESEFIIVRTHFNEASVVGAVEFIFREAARLGRPAVVNLSLGHQFGPHDGTGIFERLLSDMCGPGRLLVVAGGNDGGEGIHALLPPGTGADSVSFLVPPLPNPGDLVNVIGLEAWGPADASHRFTLVFPDGRRIGPLLPGKDHILQGVDYALNAEQRRYDFGRNLSLSLRLFSRRWPTGTFQLVAEPQGRPRRSELNFWLAYFDLNGPRVPSFVRGRDERGTLSEPANALNALSVAATVSRTCWLSASRADSVCSYPLGRVGEIEVYSSTGPTPDGRLKPEVAAPGGGIASALAAAMTPQAAADRNLPLRLLSDGRHWVNSGTSMAAPHLTGALALLLERVPDLSPDVARDRLTRTNRPLAAPPGTFVGGSLDLGPFLQSAGGAGRSSVTLLEGLRVRIVWEPVTQPDIPARFRIARGTAPRGPFDALGRADGPVARDGRRVIEDGPLDEGRTYYYRLSVVDPSGLDEPLDTLQVVVPGLARLAFRGPRVNPGPLPLRFSLLLPATAAPTPYRIEIFDPQGRYLGDSARGTWGPAAEEIDISWDGRSPGGRRVAAGLYLVRLTAGAEQRTLKAIVRG